MARPPRLDIPNVAQHVVQRGNDRMPCFFEDVDYRHYLTMLQEAATAQSCRIHAYVLMTNHVHLMATPSSKGCVSRMMQTLGRRYVSYINSKYRRTGTLWEGRYKACLVDAERYILACYRYIELNPVRVAMVADPGAYRWSSHRHNAQGIHDALTTPHETYLALDIQPMKRLAAYRALFAEALDQQRLAEIRSYLEQQRALGTPRFQTQIEAMLGRCVTTRPRGRPSSSSK
ncbi:transposase [Xanthomonas cucurbitae]|uniref:Transposase n=1 Tax=Xanthomonas cucurbitae TaxID=56453 RepID=A0A2S7DKM6_9XANT|nr:transposase [Xanthomonas cucurbitae]PPU74347.1 transposase [Xanthomonas cucurbitae]WDM79337.1 transposase [Xanthomonas cucurbitae]WDM83024.1 transposase [Xanthomonas cucurbitae]